MSEMPNSSKKVERKENVTTLDANPAVVLLNAVKIIAQKLPPLPQIHKDPVVIPYYYSLELYTTKGDD